jgi:ferric-dicitrate binding protein FerR (iron transport regulator)
LVLGAVPTLAGGRRAFAQDSPSDCAPAVARLVSLQGQVEVQRAGSAAWVTVRRLGAELCAGDRLRTDALSRAALYLQPETVVRLDQNTAVRFNQSTDEIEVEFFAVELAAELRNAQSRGAGYFITRFPKKFKVKTPHMNAAVEGTEFSVQLSEEGTQLTVLEGKVSSESAATRDRQIVDAGQRLQAGAAGAGRITAVLKPEDAVEWVLRYPPIGDQPASSPIPGGDQCASLHGKDRAGCLTTRGEGLLSSGSVTDALTAIDDALAVEADNADAIALRSVIQLSKNDKAGALESANRAISVDQGNYRAWLALSYAQQAGFDLEAALASASRADALHRRSALVLARIAELQLSLGDHGIAKKMAQASIDAHPGESHGHTVLGFVRLVQIDTSAARAEFEAAIERDSFDALPRLGLGLAKIRDGQLAKGREELEIAVALDPGSSLLRSYVGKAYYEENTRNRDTLASVQFDLAKQLDRRDPTPWFYDAILKDSQNRPIEALIELQASKARNDNRAVYRSKLLLDDDAAARSASVAAVYDTLGFEKLAIAESAMALAENAGNFSAHRQLARAYADLPRHDIARVSEALQAQIRQPVSLASTGPQLGTDNLVINRDTGPARPGTNEFNALFNRDDVRVQVDGVVGGLDTIGEQFVASALSGNFSYSLSQLHYETDGFLENDASTKDIYDVLVHGQVTPQSSIQLEVKRSDFTSGQTIFPFDEFPIPTTIAEDSDTLRVSGHHVFGAATDWIWSAVVEDRERAVKGFPDGGLFYSSEAEPYALELQYMRQASSVQLIAGAGVIEDTEKFNFEDAEIHNESANAYLYAQWKSPEWNLGIQLGVAAERFESTQTSIFVPEGETLERDEVSPKVGVIWSPRHGTTLRAAAFSALQRPFVRSQTIEPTQVAGFNQYFSAFDQFYGEFIGTSSDRIGLGIDQAIGKTAFGGGEFAWRKLSVPSFVFDRNFTWRERSGHAYLYKTLPSAFSRGPFGPWQASLSAELGYEDVERPHSLTGAEGIIELETLMAPFGIQLFSARGTSVRIATSYVDQQGVFSVDVGLPIVESDNEAWITDLSFEQRLPGRRGAIALGVRNLFDEAIDLVEIDPVNPRVATKRYVYAGFSLEF